MISETPVRLSLYAMATRFEVVLHDGDPVRLRAAGEEALSEIERLDTQLSLYRPDSDLARINANAASGAVKVEPRMFRLLQRASELHGETGGAFDITIAPLMRAWGFVGGSGRMPDPETLEAARRITGMQHVRLDPESFTIEFDRQGVELDLGAIGKGYAIERAVMILRESGVRSALLHGGTSTIYGIGAPPDADAWRAAIRHPVRQEEQLAVVNLTDRALSVSAVHGRSFTSANREFGHVIDPRTSEPTQGALVAAVAGPSPADTDALSTALLVTGEPGLRDLIEARPGYSALISLSSPETEGIRTATCRFSE